MEKRSRSKTDLRRPITRRSIALGVLAVAAISIVAFANTWATYRDGDISFRYPRSWEVTAFGDPLKKYVSPIVPRTFEGQSILTITNKEGQPFCMGCSEPVPDSRIRFEGGDAERFTQITTNGQRMILIHPLSDAGPPSCSGYWFTYIGDDLNGGDDVRVIMRILASVTCR